MGINFVPALALFGEDFYSISSQYFIDHNHDLIKFRIRNIVDDVKSVAVNNMIATIPASAFAVETSDNYRTVTPMQQCQININRMWANLCPRNGIEDIQEFYRDNYPIYRFYTPDIYTRSRVPYGPDQIKSLFHWHRQPGYSEQNIKSGAVKKKEGPYVMLLNHIDGTPWTQFSDNELKEKVGSFADDKCKIVTEIKKGVRYKTVCNLA